MLINYRKMDKSNPITTSIPNPTIQPPISIPTSFGSNLSATTSSLIQNLTESQIQIEKQIYEGLIPENIRLAYGPQTIYNIPGLGLVFIHKDTGTFY